MNQGYNFQLFERTKHDISISANKLKNYIIFLVVAAIILVIIVAVILFVVLGFSVETLSTLDPNNLYQFGQDIIDSGLFTLALIPAIFLIIVGIGVIIIAILQFVQYIKLGSGFSKLYDADRALETSKYISYGFYGYVIAVIVGFFVPGIGGTIVSIIGNLSLAVGAYFIYQLFREYRNLGRYNSKISSLLFIGLAAQVISQIISAFTYYGGLLGLVGFILMLVGFRDLSRDIKLVAPPGMQVIQPQASSSVQYAPTQTTTPVKKTTGAQYCAHCGAKLTSNSKFCDNCGAEL